MPHLTVECSPGLCKAINCQELLTFIHDKVDSLGIYRAAGRRSRLCAGEYWLVGDGSRPLEAVHILFVAKERPVEIKVQVRDILYNSILEYLDKCLAKTGIEYLLSIELGDCSEFYIG